LVWRRILVPDHVTLAKLHLILQWAMGWSNSHLHEYQIARQRYGLPDDEWPTGEPVIDERRVRLKPLLEKSLKDPTHEEHADMSRRVGGTFDPTAFSLVSVNERLTTIKV
jgi:hypothetical protein